MRLACIRVARAIALLASLASGLGAQGGAPELPSSLQPATRAAIVALGDSLTREGLPARPLYDKAAEGHLKGANDPQILTAVRSLATRLRQARQAIGATAQEADLSAAASALFAGVSPDVLRRIVAVRHQRSRAPSLTLSLTVLTGLIAKQVPTEAAVTSVESLLTRGARDVDLSEVLRTVEQEIRGGRRPVDALRERTEVTLRAIEQRRPD